MKSIAENSVVKFTSVIATAILYAAVVFFMSFAMGVLPKIARSICNFIYPHTWGVTIFLIVTFILEIPFFLIRGLIPALFMMLVFRSTSWRVGLLAAFIAVVLLYCVWWEYPFFDPFSPFQICYGVALLLSFPGACALFGRLGRLSKPCTSANAAGAAWLSLIV